MGSPAPTARRATAFKLAPATLFLIDIGDLPLPLQVQAAAACSDQDRSSRI